VFSHSQDNTEKVRDEKKKEAVKKLTDFNLAEFPKTGSGVRVKHVKPDKKVNFKGPHKKPQKYSMQNIMNLMKKTQKTKESVIRPKVPFVLNGKPFNLHAMKTKKKDKRKKPNSSNRIAFP